MTPLQRTPKLLDDTLAALDALGPADDVALVITPFVEDLQQIKDDSSPEEWTLVQEACVRHPLRLRLHEDPLTARAFFKPRSYAGDAGIIDLIYRHPWTEPLVAATTPFGRRLYEFLSVYGPIPRAIRERRRIAAEAIDECAERIARPHVLSVACGHLREVELSRAAQAGKLGRFVALDQDEESLGEIRSRYRGLDVECVRGKVESFLDGTIDLPGDFDLVYSTGLCDYLDAQVGPRLTAKLFARLRPGGRVLVANLLRGGREVAYTESFMDWHVIYRDDDDLRALADEIPPSEIADIRIIDEPDRRVAFVEITRA